jgi:hypothetical protein
LSLNELDLGKIAAVACFLKKTKAIAIQFLNQMILDVRLIKNVARMQKIHSLNA